MIILNRIENHKPFSLRLRQFLPQEAAVLLGKLHMLQHSVTTFIVDKFAEIACYTVKVPPLRNCIVSNIVWRIKLICLHYVSFSGIENENLEPKL